MRGYLISKEADTDLEDISFYSYMNWGEDHAVLYLSNLKHCFQTLVTHPSIGRDASEFFQGLKRFSYKSHMIFYTTIDTGILIVRILGQQMDYEEHL